MLETAIDMRFTLQTKKENHLEPFKNKFNKKLIKKMGKRFKKVYPKFKEEDFIRYACKNLESLELKERSSQITKALEEYLPKDFNEAGDVLLKSLEEDTGWAIMPMTDYVGLNGHKHFTLSMTLLKEMTKLFSSEFAIRYFLIKSPSKTLKVLNKWAKDKDYHVRRLASEGSRPRLPWAMMLPEFIKDPAEVIKLLENLKDDESEYVRRSVANNLNDISKDHPDLVAKIAKKWLVRSTIDRKRLVRHACRTLIKQGHKNTLKAFGFEIPKIKKNKLTVLTPQVKFGNVLEFELKFSSDLNKEQPLIVDYIVHHQKANGSTSPKVYKWKNMKLPAGKTLSLTKKHKIKKITTRVYHPGLHMLEVVINGVSMGKSKFNLKM